jgi:hypothetical protein
MSIPCQTRECQKPGLFACDFCTGDFCANDAKKCQWCLGIFCLSCLHRHTCKKLPQGCGGLIEREMAR